MIRDGHLDAFPVKGKEGLHWFFQPDDGGAAHVVEKGDILMVFNDAAKKERVWTGVVDLDFTSHRTFMPYCPALGKIQHLRSIGSVRGLQKGMNPFAWAEMFTGKKPAILIPRNKGAAP